MDYLYILVKLRKIIRFINLENKRIEKHLGVSIPQVLCLQFLSTQPDFQSSAKLIKEHLQLNASTVTGLIARLESKGLVAKLPNTKDRRGSIIALTSKGFDMILESPQTLQDKFTNRLEKLSDKELQELDNAIDLLVQVMGAKDMDAAPILMTMEIDKKPDE